jgi:hypothetical protein
VGSTALSSDYDITFKTESPGSNLEAVALDAVRAFNKRFREIFSQESGVVFDTNVYAHSTQSELVNRYGATLQAILLVAENPYCNTFEPNELALLLNLLGQSVKRNAIDIPDEIMAQKISMLLQKASDSIVPPGIRKEIGLALSAFARAREKGEANIPYEITSPLYALEAQEALTDLFQTNNSTLPLLEERVGQLVARVQEELIHAYVPPDLVDLRRYFQALPNTQLLGT